MVVLNLDLAISVLVGLPVIGPALEGSSEDQPYLCNCLVFFIFYVFVLFYFILNLVSFSVGAWLWDLLLCVARLTLQKGKAHPGWFLGDSL